MQLLFLIIKYWIIAIRKLTQPLRPVVSHYTMLCINDKRVSVLGGVFIFISFQLSRFEGVFNKPIFPLALVGYEMIIANRRYTPCWLSTISHPTRPSAQVDNTLRDLQNSSYPTKAEFNNCFIIHSKYSPFLKEFRHFALCFLLTKTQPRLQIFSVNGPIPCSGLHF